MPNEFVELLKIIGSGGVAFICFYIYHKSATAQFDRVLANQAEQSKNMFAILEKMIDQNNLQLGYLQEIKAQVGANLWCPYVRNTAGLMKGNKNNE